MIRRLKKEDINDLKRYLLKESFINYFILIGLENEEYKEKYEKIWGEYKLGRLTAVMLKRRSGKIQFYSNTSYNLEGFCDILKKEKFEVLIGEEGIVAGFKKSFDFKEKKGAFVCRLDNKRKLINNVTLSEIEKVKIYDIQEIKDLYEKVFQSSPKKSQMVTRLINNTARGYCIKIGTEIVAVAQTAYEQKNSAIIIGVATNKKHRRKGFATVCLSKLCGELIDEGKKVYLQYDNEKASGLYSDLGFKIIGRMMNLYTKGKDKLYIYNKISQKIE